MFFSLGEYRNAQNFYEKALAISKEIGDREGESGSYGNLGAVCQSFGEYGKAKEYFEKALAMAKEIPGNRESEAVANSNLGQTVFCSLGEYDTAKNITRKHLRSQRKLSTLKD